MLKKDKIHNTTMIASMCSEIGWVSLFQLALTISGDNLVIDAFTSHAFTPPDDTILQRFYIDSMVWKEYKIALMKQYRERKIFDRSLITTTLDKDLNFKIVNREAQIRENKLHSDTENLVCEQEKLQSKKVMVLSKTEDVSRLPLRASQTFEAANGLLKKTRTSYGKRRSSLFTNALTVNNEKLVQNKDKTKKYDVKISRKTSNTADQYNSSRIMPNSIMSWESLKVGINIIGFLIILCY